MNFATLASFTVCVVGLLIVLILFVKNRTLPGRFLALFLFSINYVMFLMFLYNSGYLMDVPHFFRTAPLFAYVIGPAFYLYIAFSLEKNRRLSWKYLFHLLPSLIYLVDYFPVLSSSAAFKRAILKNVMNQTELILHYREGWLFPPGVHYAAWSFISLAYMVAAVILLVRYYMRGLSVSLNRKNVFPWLITLTALNTAYFIICALLASFTDMKSAWTLDVVNSAVIVFTICIVLCFWPHVLYDGFIVYNNEAEPKKASQRQLKLPESMTDEIEKALQSYLAKNLFLNRNCSLKSVADTLQVQPYILSAHINQFYQMHFNDLINKYRIEYVKQDLLGKDRETLTLEAIAERAGYNNRTTFLSAFKKFTGMTPTAFIKQARNTGNGKDAERKNL